MDGEQPGLEAQEIQVLPGGCFRFWLGFDQGVLTHEKIQRLNSEARLGQFTLPVVANGRELEWSRTI
jgi:hypothetical protein